MHRAVSIREQGVLQFHGEKAYVVEPGQARRLSVRPRSRSKAWQAMWSASFCGASRMREYVLVHSEAPATFHTHLYAIKSPHSLQACLALHAESRTDVWQAPNEHGTLVWHLSAAGINEEGTMVEWVICLNANETEARMYLQALRSSIRRLARLSSGPTSYVCPASHPSQEHDTYAPYKSKLEWLVGSDVPVLIESSPRPATRLPSPTRPASVATIRAPCPAEWSPIETHFDSLLMSLDAHHLPAALQASMEWIDFDSLSAASSPSISPTPLRRASGLHYGSAGRRASLVVSPRRRTSLVAV
ncbi:hypothetical protein ACI68E_000316 [Malassezia pachydermatis]|uniref:Uncharacterized protein n=1 Tax=Malassezia pachydermatis TaxID=77020 RepID=A0A0M9VQG3_9BASI|nr:hypothetical protein Malapachy_2134 [Malassezia pachydermatis]KOS15509.1 hypothetical protein Malapachy_2134 [Malassezia pachydermatis]